jgi:hypothetical protein
LKKTCEQAISNAGLNVEDIDIIIGASSMPIQLLPNTSCMAHKLLGMKKIFQLLIYLLLAQVLFMVWILPIHIFVRECIKIFCW